MEEIHYVYRLWLNSNMLYVGRTKHLKSRLYTHKQTKTFDYVDYIVVDSEDIDKIEMYLISKYLPPQNKVIFKRLAREGALLFEQKYKDIEFLCSETSKITENVIVPEQEDFIEYKQTESAMYLHKDFLMVNRVINSDIGKEVSVSLVDKFVYSYIYCNSNHLHMDGSLFNESQDEIALNLGLDRKTVNRSVKKLELCGLISRHRKHTKTGTMTMYNVFDISLDRFRFFAKQTFRASGKSPEVREVEIIINEQQILPCENES